MTIPTTIDLVGGRVLAFSFAMEGEDKVFRLTFQTAMGVVLVEEWCMSNRSYMAAGGDA